jgi:hypothetical protein
LARFIGFYGPQVAFHPLGYNVRVKMLGSARRIYDSLLNNFAVTAAFWGIIAVPVTGVAEQSSASPRVSASSNTRYRAAARRRHKRAVRKTIKRVGIGAAGGAVAGAVAGGGAGAIYDQHEKDKGR